MKFYYIHLERIIYAKKSNKIIIKLNNNFTKNSGGKKIKKLNYYIFYGRNYLYSLRKLT